MKTENVKSNDLTINPPHSFDTVFSFSEVYCHPRSLVLP
jgi:hypothetical protein